MNIREIRKKTGLSQVKFAEQYSFNLRTLQDWEQGRCNPPEYVMKMLKEQNRGIFGKDNSEKTGPDTIRISMNDMN